MLKLFDRAHGLMQINKSNSEDSIGVSSRILRDLGIGENGFARSTPCTKQDVINACSVHQSNDLGGATLPLEK